MKNPLFKRLPRELKNDLGKYAVIFLFIVLLISLVSGFLVSDDSVSDAYNKGFKKYNVEDGHITFNQELDTDLKQEIEDQANITLYDLKYFEEDLSGGQTLRVYKERNEVDKVDLMSGEMPSSDHEIALDRMFAQNAELEIGDTITLRNEEYKITGLVALSDYSCLFEDNSDMMFDAINFGVAIMTDSGFESVGSNHVYYNYAWKYPTSLARDDEKNGKIYSDALTDTLEDVLTDYDEQIVDEAISKAKMVTVNEVLTTMSSSGMDLSYYNDEQLLSVVNSALEKQGIDLSKEIGEGEKEVSLDVNDIKNARDASKEEIEEAKDYIENAEDKIVDVDDYLPLYLNKAINFTGDDMGGDKATFIMFGYLVIAVIAFIFAVTSSNTIEKEASVIGTLRATGYTRKELLSHYMVLPIIVSFVAAIIGNIIGYAVIEEIFVQVYYNSYSLVTYKTLFNGDAFMLTTVIPLILMFIINYVVISYKLKISPLKFLRRDLSKNKKKKALKLSSKLSFITRFKIRILLQNIPNYITLFFGVMIAGVVVVFGLMFGPLLDNIGSKMLDTRICDYQYVLVNEVEVDNDQAEKFAMTSLNTEYENYMEDEITIYGIEEDSQYISESIDEGEVLISNGIADKFDLKDGDILTLKDPFTDEEYDFKIQTTYEYDAALAIFMPIDEFNHTFDEEQDHFSGYFSNEKLTDLTSDDVYTIIDEKQITKMSDQLTLSMGDFMGILKYFGIIMFLLVMYVLSKQIIEKDSQSISMTKILGFTNVEISKLYILATSVAVVLSLLISIPAIEGALHLVVKYYLYTQMTGYFPIKIASKCYVEMVIFGLICYIVVALLQWIKISRIPKADALKNVE